MAAYEDFKKKYNSVVDESGYMLLEIGKITIEKNNNAEQRYKAYKENFKCD